MKRKILLVIGLVGLSLLDWSCGSCERFDSYSKIKKLYSEAIMVDSNGVVSYMQSGDTAYYEDVRIVLGVSTEVVNRGLMTSGFSAYADECEVPPYIQLSNPIVDVQIFQNINGSRTNITERIALLIKNPIDTIGVQSLQGEIEDINWGLFNLFGAPEFMFSEQPLLAQSGYVIRLVDNNGVIFETETIPLYLSL